MPVLPVRRHALILAHLERHSGARTTELAALFDVTRETIRNDLAHLAGRKLLRLVRGGAVACDIKEPELAERLTANPEGKERIAERALALVPDGGRVILDSGSTTWALARKLRVRSELKVWTNDIAIALELIPVAKVTLLGGDLDPAERTLGGPDAIDMMKGHTADLAFVSLGGLSAAHGPTDFSAPGLALRRAMIEASRHAYFLADHTKFGHSAPLRWKPMEQVRGIICDIAPDRKTAERAGRMGLPLIVPQDQPL